jgi:hypothetical protein
VAKVIYIFRFWFFFALEKLSKKIFQRKTFLFRALSLHFIAWNLQSECLPFLLDLVLMNDFSELITSLVWKKYSPQNITGGRAVGG